MLGGQNRSARAVEVGLADLKISLANFSKKTRRSSKVENMVRLSFEELLAKYKKKGATQNKKN